MVVLSQIAWAYNKGAMTATDAKERREQVESWLRAWVIANPTKRPIGPMQDPGNGQTAADVLSSVGPRAGGPQ